ncbi:IS66 family insertion sequence element accessory protein TnpA [Tunicatimonas pelagia]|uniref:IS66 family insertion sequence element accessory protein TnpA n=1 Tax=Tunicatimonas pelagia TaxID=931531 RepID=UPI002665B9C5|nr:helix-turn-helix domain-containing protein [Tunicatimonas pelagia]WKN41682.1 helix-turn-helix domain-containing protein [Tunicatimonas pelagia]WKN44965.1 helix-turn-helix domain-containing protein [Tunicatimonas pelagia]WKN45270.1 helix-turn-helix domain-containing protein [Tunicatimonas pelagia]WKN46221.1 helix-turn-helix domain-containing protein [Tunicatimonas pelagia]
MAHFRTEQKMFPVVEAWQSSGQTQKAFCAAHNISVSVLAYWLRRYRDHHVDESDESVGFVPVRMDVSGPAALEVSLPSGAVLRFAQVVPVGYLKALL